MLDLILPLPIMCAAEAVHSNYALPLGCRCHKEVRASSTKQPSCLPSVSLLSKALAPYLQKITIINIVV